MDWRQTSRRIVKLAVCMSVLLLAIESSASLLDLSPLIGQMSGPAPVANLPRNSQGINPKHIHAGRVRLSTGNGYVYCDPDELQSGDYREVVMNGVCVLVATSQWYARRQANAPTNDVVQNPVGGGKAKEPAMLLPVKFEREGGDKFAYRFELKLVGVAPADSLPTVQKDIARRMKDAYCQSFAGTDRNALSVLFPEYKQDGALVSGRAVVVKNVEVSSLQYDSEKGRGVIVVRFVEGQSAAARRMARQKIEALARDKNIALYPGEAPCDGKYYLDNEKIEDGNVLEIEFRIE